jgi:putative protein kinase ArgK-like GTPase of G3E family
MAKLADQDQDPGYNYNTAASVPKHTPHVTVGVIGPGGVGKSAITVQYVNVSHKSGVLGEGASSSLVTHIHTCDTYIH